VVRRSVSHNHQLNSQYRHLGYRETSPILHHTFSYIFNSPQLPSKYSLLLVSLRLLHSVFCYFSDARCLLAQQCNAIDMGPINYIFMFIALSSCDLKIVTTH